MSETDSPPPAEMKLETAIALGAHIEQLHASEQQWLMNRLAWLFTSQSFCLLAFCTLITATHTDRAEIWLLEAMLPVFGFISCCLVGGAAAAAKAILNKLADRRAEVTSVINEEILKCGKLQKLPRMGVITGSRDPDIEWTHPWGALPHDVLPWLLAFIWLVMGVVAAWRYGCIGEMVGTAIAVVSIAALGLHLERAGKTRNAG